MSLDVEPNAVLVVIDLQKGLDDPRCGRRDNPACEDNISALVGAWRRSGRPLVLVRHDDAKADSPLALGRPGNAFKDVLVTALGDREPDLLVAKSVSSAFHGRPDLHGWLRQRGILQLVFCGVQTNRCCETTARVAGSLGYDMLFALDATHTFDDTGPDGTLIAAEDFARTTAANLDPSFGRVVSTADLLSGVSAS
jgi:nicotinamidase-related amidase